MQDKAGGTAPGRKRIVCRGEHGAIAAKLRWHDHDRDQHHDINHRVLDKGDPRRRTQAGTIGVKRENDEGRDNRQITRDPHRLDDRGHASQRNRKLICAVGRGDITVFVRQLPK